MNRFPHKAHELPSSEAFIILTENSVTIPGDERSRTNPGHGYPEHTEDNFSVEVYNNKEDLIKEVLQRQSSVYRNRNNYRVFVAKPVYITQSVKIDIIE